jgi:hypothetical protein
MAGDEEEWMWLFREFCLPRPEVSPDEFENDEAGQVEMDTEDEDAVAGGAEMDLEGMNLEGVKEKSGGNVGKLSLLDDWKYVSDDEFHEDEKSEEEG